MTIIPADQLSPDTLTALIEEFVTRHGAIHGQDTEVETKIAQVRRMLESGNAAIVWDEEHETATILTREELKVAQIEYQKMIAEPDHDTLSGQ